MSTCQDCGGRGTNPVEITNTQTGRTQTLNQTCLSCMGTGQVPR